MRLRACVWANWAAHVARMEAACRAEGGQRQARWACLSCDGEGDNQDAIAIGDVSQLTVYLLGQHNRALVVTRAPLIHQLVFEALQFPAQPPANHEGAVWGN